jgi:hypothetical protein
MMLALALSAAAFDIEVQFGGEPSQLFVVDEAVSEVPFSMPGLPDLFNMVEQMQMQQMQQMQRASRPTPTHPCENDQVRFRCVGESATVGCLKAHMRELSTGCSNYLLKMAEPEPSPSPAAITGSVARIFTDQNGQLRVENGAMNSREARKVAGEFELMMEEFMPEMFAGFFNEPMRQQPRQAAPPARKPTNTHPCEREVNQCNAELQTPATGRLSSQPGRGEIQQCLISHYEQLSADCKCFLHQVMGDELEKAVPAAKSNAAPRMRTVDTPVYRNGAYFLYETEPIHKPSHKLTCALFMTMFAISVGLVLYRMCYCCCAPKPKFAAVVPPMQPVKMSIEPLVAPAPAKA